MDKLVRTGASWLAQHPERAAITTRYLAGQRSLVSDATARLLASDDAPADLADGPQDVGSAQPGPVVRGTLRRQRLDAVKQALADTGARTVVDLGCGEGTLIRELVPDGRWSRLLGADVSIRCLERAARALNLGEASDAKRERISFIQSSITYRDERVAGFDAAVLQEVIEHLDPGRLPAAVQCVFGFARPGAVILTTPNCEYNVRYPGLQPGGLRHTDHRFEWTRAQFATWAGQVCADYGYSVQLRDVGDTDPEVGPPTQLALFTKAPAQAPGTASGTTQEPATQQATTQNPTTQEATR